MTTMQTDTSYVFDQAWQRELERLRSLEALFDPASRRHLSALGLAPGWRCLEIGCGAGSVARWLADEVAPDGSVLATDLDPRFLEGHEKQNLQVMRHNVLADVLPATGFDVIHARAVLVHLPDPRGVLERLFHALKPNGWLVIEDVDFGGTAAELIARYTVPSRAGDMFERFYRAIAAVFAGAGADATFGARVPGLLAAAGLQAVGGELHAPLLTGGTPDWVSLSYEQLVPHVRALGLLSEADLEAGPAVLADRNSRYLPPLMVTAWGQRPA